MVLAIRADFPLGVYQGHEDRSIPEKYPQPVRLFDALLSAAHGLAAFRGDDGKDDKTGLPSELHNVIDWLEKNRPDAISLPKVYSVYDETGPNPAPSVFRKTGEMNGDRYKIKEVAVSRFGIGGPITWFWNEAPEAAVVDLLRKIAHEVPYLGESSSVVLLSVDDSLSAIPESALFRRGKDLNDLGRPENELMYVAGDGRAEALQKQYVELHPCEPETKETKKKEHPKPYYTLCRERVIYGKKSVKEPPARKVPWPRGLLLTVEAPEGVEWPPKDKDRVAWCLALHRTLVKKCDPNPPEALTGRYASGNQPANNIAIQIIDDSLPVKRENKFEGTAFLLMLPNTMSKEDVTLLRRVVKEGLEPFITKSKTRQQLTLHYDREIDLCDFWAPPAENHRRYFEVQPLFILESRGPESLKKQGHGIARAAEIALGYVYRDFLSLGETRGDKRLEMMLDKVSAKNVDVRAGRQVDSLDLNFYIHKKKSETSLWAGTALIYLGNLDESACSLIAIGQSRHYGTGLLVPVDIPFDNGAGHDNDGGAAHHG